MKHIDTWKTKLKAAMKRTQLLERDGGHVWQKQRPIKSFLKGFGQVEELNQSLLQMGSVEYELIKLALRPLGGSLVILTPFCKTETGKTGDGYEDNQRRKSLCGF